MNSLMNKSILLPAVGKPPIHAPLFSHKVAAGFPSPADDYIEGRLSLDEHLISNRDATFFVRAKGNSMVTACLLEVSFTIPSKYSHFHQDKYFYVRVRLYLFIRNASVILL